MQPVITPAQASDWDAAATDSVETLMDRAGLAVSITAAHAGATYGRRVLILAGPGNNGGDGYIAAKYMGRRGAAVQVMPLEEPQTEACRWASLEAQRAHIDLVPWRLPDEVKEPDLVVDALFGAGFRGLLPEAARPWTRASIPVVAVDVPSGLDASTGETGGPAFHASHTTTFGALKVGHLLARGPELSGDVAVVDIGLPIGSFEFALCDEEDAPRPPRSRSGHKWSVGSVFIVGGSAGISGAVALAARSALNSGAGAVMMAVPGSLEDRVKAPELMTVGIGSRDRYQPGDALEVLKAAERFDVLAIGPGLGPDQTEFVAQILADWEKSLVIDADGLNAIDDPRLLGERSAPTVLTPHAGEFRRLTGAEPSYQAAVDFATAHGVVVVLKGSPTFIAGEDLWGVTTGGSELASIGTGDVLTGMVSTLWARGLDAEAAARSAVYWHGRAGNAVRTSGTVTADHLAEEVARWVW